MGKNNKFYHFRIFCQPVIQIAAILKYPGFEINVKNIKNDKIL